MAMQEQIIREVSEQMEQSISEQMSVLACAIGLRQDDLDRYENELRVGASPTLPVFTDKQIEALRAYVNGTEFRRT